MIETIRGLVRPIVTFLVVGALVGVVVALFIYRERMAKMD